MLMLVAIAMAVIFAGCEKNEILPPDLEQDALEESTLKGAKVKDKRSFEGICNVIDFGEGIWHDETDDWRTTGTSYWYYNEAKTAGTATLIVDAKNPHKENRGKWEMEWEFVPVEQPEVGVLMVATATGIGVEGKVKGMQANWTYTFHYTGPLDGPSEFPFDINDPSFHYVINGNIVKPQGPIKHLD